MTEIDTTISDFFKKNQNRNGTFHPERFNNVEVRHRMSPSFSEKRDVDIIPEPAQAKNRGKAKSAETGAKAK